MSNNYPSDVLNRLKWKEGESIAEARIIITHRGAAGDRKEIPGGDVVSIGHQFFETIEATIPFHRVQEIWYRGEKIFEKKRKTND